MRKEADMATEMDETCPSRDYTASQILMTSKGDGASFSILSVLITAVTVLKKTKSSVLV